MNDFDARVAEAIRYFWLTRTKQSKNQGSKTGQRDAGHRTAVTGGKHLDGFVELCRDLLVESGLPEAGVYWNKRMELPGFFRAEKNWDLLAVVDGHLLAVIVYWFSVTLSFGESLVVSNKAD